ncbi:MAG: glycosyltransferase family 87 protein [Roseiflexaceae bacterium]
MQHSRVWRISALVIVVLGFGILQVGMNVSPWRIAVGPGDGIYFADMHAAEAQANSFRWTKAQSTIKLPLLHHGWSTVAVRMLNQYPTAEVVEVRMRAGMRVVTLQIPSGSTRMVTTLVQSRFGWQWYTPLVLETTPKQFGDDPRMLGVSVSRIDIMPTDGAFGAHSVILVMGALLALGLWVIGQWLQLQERALVVGLGVIAVAYYTLLIWYPQQFVPYIHWCVAWLWLGVGTLGFARVTHLFDRNWYIKGLYLPIVLAVWWWCMPLIQLLLMNDGMPIPPWQLQVAPWLTAGVLSSWGISEVIRRRMPAVGYWPMFVILAMAGLGYAAWQYLEMLDKGSGDFGIWYLASQRWVFEGVLYKLDNIVDNPFAGYKRPPFYIMMFTPFVQMNELDLLNAYRVLNIGLLGLTLGMWYRLMAPATPAIRWWWVAVMAILVNYQPLLDALRYGQTDIVLLFCFTLMWWFVQRGRDGWAGAVIAFLTSIKIYPIVLLTFWGVKQRWWALAGFVLGMIGWNAIAVVVMGWDLHVMFLREVLPSIGGTTSWIENQTIAGFLTRFYEDEAVMNLFSTPGIARVASIISMLLSAIVSLTAMRDWQSDRSEYGLQYALFIMLMVIAIPVAWIHYATILILPMLLLLNHYRERDLSLMRSLLLMVSYGLIAFGDQRSFNYMYDLGAVTVILSSYKFYGMVMLTGLLLYEVWQERVTWGQAWVDLGRKLLHR